MNYGVYTRVACKYLVEFVVDNLKTFPIVLCPKRIGERKRQR